MSSRSSSPPHLNGNGTNGSTSNGRSNGSSSKVTPSPPKRNGGGDFPRSFSRDSSDSSNHSGTYRSPSHSSSINPNTYRLDTSGSGRDTTRMNLGGIVADAGVLTMMELQAGDSGRGSSSMYSGNSTPVSHSSRKKAGAAIGGGSVVGGGRHLRVDSHDFCDDNLSVATDATDRQVGGNGRTAKLHNQEMVDVSVDQEYGEFGETDPYSYKARKTLWGSSINTRDGILRDHGLAVFTTRRQKIRYYSIFACMMISLVVIIGVSVSVTQPGKNNGDEEDTREPLVPPTTTTTTTTDEQQQTPTDQEAMTATDNTDVASATPPRGMCDYVDDDDAAFPTPLVQCFCEGGISRWKEGQLDRHQKRSRGSPS